MASHSERFVNAMSSLNRLPWSDGYAPTHHVFPQSDAQCFLSTSGPCTTKLLSSVAEMAASAYEPHNAPTRHMPHTSR